MSARDVASQFQCPVCRTWMDADVRYITAWGPDVAAVLRVTPCRNGHPLPDEAETKILLGICPEPKCGAVLVDGPGDSLECPKGHDLAL